MLLIKKDCEALKKVHDLLAAGTTAADLKNPSILTEEEQKVLYRFLRFKRIRQELQNNQPLTETDRNWLCKVFGVENTIDHWGTILGLYEYAIAYYLQTGLEKGEYLDEHGGAWFEFNSNLGLFFGFQCALSFVSNCYIPLKKLLSESARLHALIYLEKSTQLQFKQELLAEQTADPAQTTAKRLKLLDTTIAQVVKQKEELENFIKEQNIMLKSRFLDKDMDSFENLHEEINKNAINLMVIYEERLHFLNDLKERIASTTVPTLVPSILAPKPPAPVTDAEITAEITQDKQEITKNINDHLHQPLYDSVYIDHEKIKGKIDKDDSETFKNYSIRESSGLYANLIDLISQRIAYEEDGNENWLTIVRGYVKDTKLEHYFADENSEHVQDVFRKSRRRAERRADDKAEFRTNNYQDTEKNSDGQYKTLKGTNTYYSDSIQEFHRQEKREAYYLEKSIKQTHDKIKLYENLLASVNHVPGAETVEEQEDREKVFNELNVTETLEYLNEQKQSIADATKDAAAKSAATPAPTIAAADKNALFIHQTQRLDTQIYQDVVVRRGYRIYDYFSTVSKGLKLVFAGLMKPRKDVDSATAYDFKSYIYDGPEYIAETKSIFSPVINLWRGIKYTVLQLARPFVFLIYLVPLAVYLLFTYAWAKFGFLLKSLQFTINTLHKGARNTDESLTFKDGELAEVLTSKMWSKGGLGLQILWGNIKSIKDINFNLLLPFALTWWAVKVAFSIPLFALLPLYELSRPLLKIVLAVGLFVFETLGAMFYYCLGPFAQDSSMNKIVRAITPGWYADGFEFIHKGYTAYQDNIHSKVKKFLPKALAAINNWCEQHPNLAWIVYPLVNWLLYPIIYTVFNYVIHPVVYLLFYVWALPGAILNAVLTPLKRVFNAVYTSYVHQIIKGIGSLFISAIDWCLSKMNFTFRLGNFFSWLGSKFPSFTNKDHIDKARDETNRVLTLVDERVKAYWTRRVLDPISGIHEFYTREKTEIKIQNKFGLNGTDGDKYGPSETDYIFRGVGSLAGVGLDVAETLATTPLLVTFTALTISNLAPGFGWSLDLLHKFAGLENVAGNAHGFNWTFGSKQSQDMLLSAIILDSKNGLQDIYNLSDNRLFMEMHRKLEEPVLEYQKLIRDMAKPRVMTDDDRSRAIYIVYKNELRQCTIETIKKDSAEIKYLTLDGKRIAQLKDHTGAKGAQFSIYDPRSQYEIISHSAHKLKLFHLSATESNAKEQYINYQLQLIENEKSLYLKLPKIPMTEKQITDYIKSKAYTESTATATSTKNALTERQDKRLNRSHWTTEYIACSAFIEQGKEIKKDLASFSKGTDEHRQYERMKPKIESNNLKEILAHTLAFAAMKTGSVSVQDIKEYEKYHDFFLNSKSIDPTITYFNQMFGLDDFDYSSADDDLKEKITSAFIAFSEGMASQLLATMNTVRYQEELAFKEFAVKHPDLLQVYATDNLDNKKYYIKYLGNKNTFDLVWDDCSAEMKVIATLTTKPGSYDNAEYRNLGAMYSFNFTADSPTKDNDAFFYHTRGNAIDLGMCLDAMVQDYPSTVKAASSVIIATASSTTTSSSASSSASPAAAPTVAKPREDKNYSSCVGDSKVTPSYAKQKAPSRTFVQETYKAFEMRPVVGK